VAIELATAVVSVLGSALGIAREVRPVETSTFRVTLALGFSAAAVILAVILALDTPIIGALTVALAVAPIMLVAVAAAAVVLAGDVVVAEDVKDAMPARVLIADTDWVALSEATVSIAVALVVLIGDGDCVVVDEASIAVALAVLIGDGDCVVVDEASIAVALAVLIGDGDCVVVDEASIAVALVVLIGDSDCVTLGEGTIAVADALAAVVLVIDLEPEGVASAVPLKDEVRVTLPEAEVVDVGAGVPDGGKVGHSRFSSE
jgi:hypothetical protein